MKETKVMKRISLVLIIVTTILIGCKQPTSPSVPSVPSVPTPETVNLEGITGIEQEVGGGTTSIGKTKLVKEEDKYKGVLVSSAATIQLSVTGSEEVQDEVVDGEETPETDETPVAVDTISVLFEQGVELEVSEKQEIVKQTIVDSYRQPLYNAGLKEITVDNVRVHIDSSYTSAEVTIENVQARSGYTFDGLSPTICFTLTGDFTGKIDITKILGESTEAAVEMAGVSPISLAETTAYEVSFFESDIFVEEVRKTAVESAIKLAFEGRLAEAGITIANGSVALVETAGNEIAEVSFTATTSNPTVTFVQSGTQERTVTIPVTNENGAFTGNLKAITQADINVSFLPTIQEAVVMGSSNWAIRDGLPAGGSRKVAVKEGSGMSGQTIADAMAVELLKFENATYSYTGIGSLEQDSENSEKFNVPVTFTKKDVETGEYYLFFNGSTTYTQKVSVLFQEGELTVTDEDFAETLEALTNKDNLAALATENADGGLEVTLDITGDISKGDENDTDGSFTIDAGDSDKPLNVKLETSKEGGAQVSGGGILTSLVVQGDNTTVTVGKGITINGGYKNADKDGHGGGVTVTDGATFILDGGIIEGNFSEVNDYTKGGGAVSILNGTFIMNSGTIKDNTAFRGAGVYLHAVDADKTSTFIMNGGSIENNTTIIEKDGSINAATGGGSGVFVYGARAHFIMGESASSDGSIPTIKGNVASRMGSAITISTNGNVSIHNGLITENIGPYGIIGMAAKGTLTMTGGQITKNVYGPTLEDGTPDASRISLVDVPQIKSYILGADGAQIPYSIVADHSGNELDFTWTGGTIEGAPPVAETP